MPDGGAAVIAAITAAARHAGVTNPIDAMRAVIAQRRQKELQAVERAEEAQVLAQPAALHCMVSSTGAGLCIMLAGVHSMSTVVSQVQAR